MKSLIAIIILSANVANAGIEFTKGGIDHPTKEADGVYLYGQEAVQLFNALKTEAKINSQYLQKTISLDGQVPTTKSFIQCVIANSENALSQLKSAECYMGTISNK